MAEPIIADRRLWQTADGRLVEEGDPEAATLVAGEGSAIPPEVAERLHLKREGEKVVQEKTPEAPGGVVSSTAPPEPAPASPSEAQPARRPAPPENAAAEGGASVKVTPASPKEPESEPKPPATPPTKPKEA